MPTFTRTMEVEFEYRAQYPDKALGEIEPVVMVWVASIGGVQTHANRLPNGLPFNWSYMDEKLSALVEDDILAEVMEKM